MAEILPSTLAERSFTLRHGWRGEYSIGVNRQFRASTAYQNADDRKGSGGERKEFRERRVPDGPFERAFAFGSLAAEIAVGAAGQMARRSVAGPSANGMLQPQLDDDFIQHLRVSKYHIASVCVRFKSNAHLV